jgi:hypothetical protein
MYRIEYKLKDYALAARKEKYPDFYQTNGWKIYEKFNDKKKRNAIFEKLSEEGEFLFRKFDPKPESKVKKDV